MYDIYVQIDKDGSGTIDLDELKAAVQFTSNASVRDLIQRADLNGDGVIDYGEYERLMNMEVRTGIHAAGASVKKVRTLDITRCLTTLVPSATFALNSDLPRRRG
jgi:hypothetical protein